MGRRTRRQQKRLEAKRTRRAASQRKPGGKSPYARKRQWLRSHRDTDGLQWWGFQVYHKPWKTARA